MEPLLSFLKSISKLSLFRNTVICCNINYGRISIPNSLINHLKSYMYFLIKHKNTRKKYVFIDTHNLLYVLIPEIDKKQQNNMTF